MAVDNEGRKIMEKKKEILGKLIIRAVHKTLTLLEKLSVKLNMIYFIILFVF